jgi:DNA replication protein DnaC
MKKLQGTFDPGSGLSESQILRPIHAADILLLDDLGAGRTSEWARDVLHEIITHRYDHNKQMIITTNCELESSEEEGSAKSVIMGSLTLRQRLGDALMSRLYEMCRMVQIEGEDYRRKIKNEEITRA